MFTPVRSNYFAFFPFHLLTRIVSSFSCTTNAIYQARQPGRGVKERFSRSQQRTNRELGGSLAEEGQRGRFALVGRRELRREDRPLRQPCLEPRGQRISRVIHTRTFPLLSVFLVVFLTFVLAPDLQGLTPISSFLSHVFFIFISFLCG